MKPFSYILTAFFIICIFPFGLANAGDTWTWPVGGKDSQPELYDGHYQTHVAANNALVDAHPDRVAITITGNSELSGSGCWAAHVPDGTGGYNYYYACWNTEYTGPEGIPQLDTDGDGIPDSMDMYPDDSTPYMVKMVTYFTADGTANGPHVGEIWVTDRGDYFQVGEIPDTDSPEWKDGFFVPDGTWVDPSTNDGPNIGTPSQTNDQVIDQPEYKTGAPTGDTPEGNELTGKPGTPSTGSETDNQALHGIQDNTSAIADNTKRQLDYMKDLNKAIQNMDRNLARIGGGTGTGTGTETGDNSDVIENDNTNRDADQSEANAAESNFNSVSVTDHYSGISGELVEGQDYELPGELSEEGFISDFFASNPLIMAFENSGFESSGSTATATLSLGDLGSHQIDLSPLQSGFELAGNLLFGLCSIGALIIVVRG